MKVLLINVCLRPSSKKLIFPIGLGYIATAIKNAGFDLEIIDLDVLRWSCVRLSDYLKSIDFDVVCMGCIVTGYRRVKVLSHIIKRIKDVPIIAGNSVADSIPYLLLNRTDVDICVKGEGDITIVQLLQHIKNNLPLETVDGIIYKTQKGIVCNNSRNLIKNLDSLPIIDYNLFDMEKYLFGCRYNVGEPYPIPFDELVAMPINTARGCPYNCTFCYHVFKGERYRVRSVEHIGKEIKLLQEKYNVNYLQFFDELSISSKQRAIELADYFIENNLNVYWIGNCRAGLFTSKDKELLWKLRESGCIGLGFSLESAEPSILKAMNKHISVDAFKKQVLALQQVGISPYTSLVVGYPQETRESLQKTFDCCFEVGVYPSMGYLLPQPMTPMYDYAVRNNIIFDEEYYLMHMGDRQDFRINLTSMPKEEIEDIVTFNLNRIALKLDLDLSEDDLIKTEHSKSKRMEDE